MRRRCVPSDMIFLRNIRIGVWGICFFLLVCTVRSQPITGIWKGKMGSSRMELKLVRKGDSLTGTSYYYDSKDDYRRYAVKGYFDDRAMDVVWWDDVLLEDHTFRRIIGSGPGDALMAVADFNCPGEGIMKMDGKSSLRDNEQKGNKDLHLVKGPNDPVFPDEWDFVLDNYAYSVSNPGIIDSIERIAFAPAPVPAGYEEAPLPAMARMKNRPVGQPETSVFPESSLPGKSVPDPIVRREPEKELPAVPVPALTNEQKFNSRTKILQTVIPVKGDSIELRFYDNAEIDGDSIAVFLNGRMLREHILLSDRAYSFKIPVIDLQADNELVMVAENLGTIPPNTSLMVAVVGDKKYEAHLQSTEGSSALVRLVKP
ncbi:MAG: hypothetical protein Q8939_12240 [Bacteroidota bacterium]|nr:hypothetical protein [Bacteroidota bacterium]